ncbi:hypothetical protein [Microbacterium sp. 3J1]|uniref:hypothetical protein n=1 Tax=Microbacterium sp. 3J1 TaxID=861269 RepID=UPI000B253A40|nr:hypothetical protein [Microbacterium sp. 3J1]
MNDTDVSIDERIRSFAAAVRTHLDDLPDDELDEIVGGLSADLADQAADNDGVLELGDPEAYADELRSAAGLPPREEVIHRRRLRERLRAGRTRVVDGIRRSSIGAWVLDLLLALRPVWWVLRGIGLYAALAALIAYLPPFPYPPFQSYGMWEMPSSPLHWLALLGFVVVSVQWGRDRWLPRNPLRHVRTVAGILAVLVLPGIVTSLLTPRVEHVYTSDPVGVAGLALDGVQINNIFAFDADGNPIERVQLFTGKGTPLDLYGTGGGQVMYTEDGEALQFGSQDNGQLTTIPSEDYRGKPVWNIYPLDEAEWDPMTGQPDLSTTKHPAPPFLKAPSIDAASATPTPTPDPQPTPTPAP